MKRKHLDDMTWHVVMRGARRLLLFRDDADKSAFLRYLAEGLAETRVSLHSWVLMDNHYHLLVSAGWRDLGKCMQLVNRRFSRGNNAKHELKGHLFERSYAAFPQSTDFWIGRTARYIDFNPVRAGLTRTPEQYRWSSCRSYAGGEKSLLIPLDKEPVLKAFGGIKNYMKFEPPAKSGKASKETSATEIWLEHIAWLLAFAQEQSAELEDESPQTVAVAWARRAGVPPRIIAQAFGYSNGHSVSVLLEGLRKRAESQSHLRKILARTDLIK